jgi:hypothetical protein
MKMNKLTSALLALGVISFASAAQANTVIYLTGSTAARSIVFNAAETAGQIFTAPATLPAGGNSSSSSIVYEGTITGVGVVDLVASFTGSEAGIAAVAGQNLTQNVNGGTFALPGVPPSFLVGPTWTTSHTLPIAGDGRGVSVPDLTLADSSQAVSQTPKSLFNLKDYGIVGIVPFTFQKGYEATPDQSWNDLVNVTTGEANQNLAGPLVANFYTGNAADSDSVVIVGRNLGSGTRVNTLLNAQYGINTPVDQFAYDVSYPTATPGVLTFGGSFAAGQAITETFNDGFDSGSGVQKVLNVDGTGSGVVLVGYVGISDAKNAFNHTSGGGAAAYLTYNGVYESDAGVINGSYSFWGQEHLLGTVGQSGVPLTVGNAVASGIAAQLTSSGAGTAAGNVSTNPSQSVLIPKGLLQVNRSADAGFPVQGPF